MTNDADHTDRFIWAMARCIDLNRLIEPRQDVVLGVSGGPDSVALLCALRELAREPQRSYRLAVGHLNHRLRVDADDDASFVQQLCQDLNVPCVVHVEDVAAEARRSRQGIEQTARRLRYEFLVSMARSRHASRVAVAHHADDNVETILHRIVRGTHLRGLSGMPLSRPLEGEILLIRPMLQLRRAEVEDFCFRRKLQWRQDETNLQTIYSRNFIRQELLPLLRRRLNARTDEAILRLASAATQAQQLISQQAQDALRAATVEESPGRRVLSAGELAGRQPIVVTEAMRIALERIGAPMGGVSGEHLREMADMACAGGGGAVSLPGGFVARREGARLIIERRLEAPVPPPQIVVLDCPGLVKLPDARMLSCRTGPLDPQAFGAHRLSPRAGIEMLDADALRGRLTVRPRRDGDSFVPLGCAGRQSVGDFLTNLKLSAEHRRQVLCVCDELGIVYVAPLRIDDRVKVTPQTQRVLELSIRPAWPGGQEAL